MAEKKGGAGLPYDEWKARYGEKEKLRVTIYAPDLKTREQWEQTATSEGTPLSRWVLNRIDAGGRKIAELEDTTRKLRAAKNQADIFQQQAEKYSQDFVRIDGERVALETRLKSLEEHLKVAMGRAPKPRYIEFAGAMVDALAGVGKIRARTSGELEDFKRMIRVKATEVAREEMGKDYYGQKVIADVDAEVDRKYASNREIAWVVSSSNRPPEGTPEDADLVSRLARSDSASRGKPRARKVAGRRKR